MGMAEFVISEVDKKNIYFLCALPPRHAWLSIYFLMFGVYVCVRACVRARVSECEEGFPPCVLVH